MSRPATDSRQYITAFALRSAEDCPADFALPDTISGFDAGIFLPGDDPEWHGRSRYPPRVLLLTGGALTVISHPSASEPARTWPMEQISMVESGHMLLKGWLRFAVSGFDCAVRYNTRGAPSVDRFMRCFRSQLLRNAQPHDGPAVHLGEPLDIKFGNALESALDSAEAVQVQVFQRPEVSRKMRLAGDLLVLTDRRLLWITDREKGFRCRYGSIASYAPIGAVSHAAPVPGGLQVHLNGAPDWLVPVAPACTQAVERLAAAIVTARTSSPCRSATVRT